MRKQEKVILWPVYFDSTKSREAGRRISRELAVPGPRIAEIKEAADRLGLSSELVSDTAFSKFPWAKTGKLLVEKNGSKVRTIVLIAEQLRKTRANVQAEQKN